MAADTEAHTLSVIGTIAQQLEKEIEAAAINATLTSERNTYSAVDSLRQEVRAHLAQNHADFERGQQETMQTVVRWQLVWIH